MRLLVTPHLKPLVDIARFWILLTEYFFGAS